MSISRRSILAGITAAVTLPQVSRASADQLDDQYFSGAAEDNGFTYRATNMTAIDPDRKSVV